MSPFNIKLLSVAIFSFVLCHQSLAQEHNVYLDLGSFDFGWKEFDFEEDNFDYVEVVDESGSLNSIGLGYSYAEGDNKISVNFNRQSGSVDYYGRVIVPGDDDFWADSSSDYSITTIEGVFGKYFEVDYVKPFAGIIGGYSERERVIHGVDPAPPITTEKMDYFYWGLLLDVEVFSWQNFSVNLGAQFTRSAEGKQRFIEDKIEVNLEQVAAHRYTASANYNFYESWSAGIVFFMQESKMDRSEAVDDLLQPESKEDHSYLGLRLEKSF